IGRYADFSCVDYTSDEYAGLARRYLEFSDNAFMSDDAVAAYGIVQMVADAVANVGDDPVAIAEYLHGQTYDLEGYAHPMSWTEWGELAESRPVFTVISEGPAPDGLTKRATGGSRSSASPSPSSHTSPSLDVALLELHGVGKAYGGLPAVDGVSLGTGGGGRLAPVGPNGAGKRALAHSLVGLARPNRG